MRSKLVEYALLAIVAFGLGLAAVTLGAAADRTEFRAPVADRWAVVNSDGTLARHAGAVSSALISRGTYRVTFASSVAQCVYQATLGNAGAGIPPVGKISVATAAGFGVSKAVLVVARTSAGTPTSAGFHLFVSCPDTRDASVARTVEKSAATAATESRLSKNDRWAFVGGSGNLQEGRGVVETRLVGDGTFEVIFDRNVTQCAYIASLASAGHQSDQIGVAARGRNPNGVFVKTTTYAGDPFGLGFYLALKCPPPALAEAVARRTDAADRWAVVRADGRLIRGLGVQSSVRIGKGEYMLRIDRKGLLYRCMFLVTLGAVTAGQGAPSGMGFATFYDGFNDGHQYAWVRTNAVPWTPPSSRADRPFHLYVVCR